MMSKDGRGLLRLWVNVNVGSPLQHWISLLSIIVCITARSIHGNMSVTAAPTLLTPYGYSTSTCGYCAPSGSRSSRPSSSKYGRKRCVVQKARLISSRSLANVCPGMLTDLE